eukprot:TRINITY_DN1556_c0_g1_i1.p1 TRINITY_DN1556_c0_g1~~TRINITY_DN1556_c0_g1_i1.p1  ORF type:complete len:96 (+),score=14.10 TRINITY_DN1556_c0_g1_i1:64-351(+)
MTEQNDVFLSKNDQSKTLFSRNPTGLLAAFSTLGFLGYGLYVFLRGGAESGMVSNKLMRLRCVGQVGTVGILLLGAAYGYYFSTNPKDEPKTLDH